MSDQPASHGTAATTSIDPKVFRRTMGCFATGVTVVTTKNGADLEGMTVNSFTSVSLSPTLILVCFTNGSRTAEAVRERGWFAVNVLEEQQQALSNRFARPHENHYEGIDYVLGEYDLPLLPGCLAYFICRVHRIDPAGDHIIVIGEVVKAEQREGSPLLFFRGAYAALPAANP